MGVTHKHPTIPWTHVWTTKHTAWVSKRLKSLWYTVRHEIVPTNERLATIHLTHRTMQPVWENGYPPTPNHRLR